MKISVIGTPHYILSCMVVTDTTLKLGMQLLTNETDQWAMNSAVVKEEREGGREGEERGRGVRRD